MRGFKTPHGAPAAAELGRDAILTASSTEHQLDAMHDYQTLMGNVQDAQVLLAAVDKFLCKRDVEPRMAVRFRKELLTRRQTAIKRYLNAADRLENFWPG